MGLRPSLVSNWDEMDWIAVLGKLSLISRDYVNSVGRAVNIDDLIGIEYLGFEAFALL